jgi:NADH:ubiquinone oxidoreductase subunit
MRNNLSTLLWTRLRGERVGEDEFGNVYYRNRQPRLRKGSLADSDKRWVLFSGEVEASRIPPRWHAWLHHTIDAPPDEGGVRPRQAWEKPHEPNRTMTAGAYRPPGHILRGGRRARGSGDYEPWKPS